jgi:hypothetical protein
MSELLLLQDVVAALRLRGRAQRAVKNRPRAAGKPALRPRGGLASTESRLTDRRLWHILNLNYDNVLAKQVVRQES